MTLFLHLARRALLTFLGALVGVVVLFVAVEFAEGASAFQGEGALGAAARVYGYRAAALAWQVAPVAMLLAASLVASGLRRTREYDALRALGLGPWRVVLPVLAVAGLVAVAMVALDDGFSAEAAARADAIKASRGAHVGAWARWQDRKTWFRGKGGRRIYELRGAGPEGSFERVTILDMGQDFRLERRVDAARMIPAADGSWTLEEVEERRFEPDGAMVLEGVERRSYRFEEDPEAFAVRPGWPTQMTRAVLAEQVAVRSRLGLPTAEYALELQRKLAHPFSAVPASLLGLALALRRNRRGFVTASLAEAVGISLASYGLQGLASSMARSGQLQPAIAAWMPDAVVALAGLWALWRWR
ncbi:MAG TPA: LptF/LptG family permease [Anaeromyxobacteraceae bacterium]|nr:LptF/LptG family permease [Anaeromyxobacteraceae bacterium]